MNAALQLFLFVKVKKKKKKSVDRSICLFLDELLKFVNLGRFGFLFSGPLWPTTAKRCNTATKRCVALVHVCNTSCVKNVTSVVSMVSRNSRKSRITRQQERFNFHFFCFATCETGFVRWVNELKMFISVLWFDFCLQKAVSPSFGLWKWNPTHLKTKPCKGSCPRWNGETIPRTRITLWTMWKLKWSR